MKRVVAYIDGFNLYFGLRSKGWRRYYWLDVQKLAANLLSKGQELVAAKYFTARVSATSRDPDKAKRQSIYLDALKAHSDTKIVYGHYLAKPIRCFKCSATWQTHEEKMTDVNIAVELLTDAFDGIFDTALIISGDSDLSRAIELVRNRFPGKSVCVAFPPTRISQRLQNIANAYFVIGRRKLAQSQLPSPVMTADGYALERPLSWA